MTDHTGPQRYECNPGTKSWHPPAFVTQFWPPRDGFGPRGAVLASVSIFGRPPKAVVVNESIYCFVSYHSPLMIFRLFWYNKNGNGRQNRFSGAKIAPRVPKLGYKGARIGATTQCRVTLVPLNQFPYLLSISCSIHGSNKRSFNKLYECSRAESSIYVVKIIQQLLYSVNMFNWIDSRKYITAINKRCIHFFFIWITQMIFV